MEAKLGIAEYGIYNKSYSTFLRREECRDAVVPDTFPDISEVLSCEGRLLIRSKDVSSGRVRTELNVYSNVFYKGEDGKIHFLDIVVPVVLIAEDDAITEGSLSCAKTEIIRLDARALNPRKILVRAEVTGEISVFNNMKFEICKDVEDEEHIKSKICSKEASFVNSVGEKTFALTDEIAMPVKEEGIGSVNLSGCSCSVEDIKAVGTKLIVKGKVKCSYFYINKHGEISKFESASDYSQIIELGCESGQGLKTVWITASGAYCNYNENENRISLELHLVAQFVCRNTVKLEYINDAYSNRFSLLSEKTEKTLECFDEPLRIRESLRQLLETSGTISNILSSTLFAETPIVGASEIKLPVNFSLICSGEENTWCECRKTEFSIRLPNEKKYIVNSIDIVDWTVIPVPGGIELRLELSAELCAYYEDIIDYVSAITYDENAVLDNTKKPSLTLLRVNEDDDIWLLAKDNCSSPEAILSANGIDDLMSAAGRMILIPKTY